MQKEGKRQKSEERPANCFARNTIKRNNRKIVWKRYLLKLRKDCSVEIIIREKNINGHLPTVNI